MTPFKISGTYYKSGHLYNFSKTVNCEKEEEAKERAYCLMGSNHKIMRKQIHVESVAKVTEEKQVAKPVVSEDPKVEEKPVEEPKAEEASKEEPVEAPAEAQVEEKNGQTAE